MHRAKLDFILHKSRDHPSSHERHSLVKVAEKRGWWFAVGKSISIPSEFHGCMSRTNILQSYRHAWQNIGTVLLQWLTISISTECPSQFLSHKPHWESAMAMIHHSQTASRRSELCLSLRPGGYRSEHSSFNQARLWLFFAIRMREAGKANCTRGIEDKPIASLTPMFNGNFR